MIGGVDMSYVGPVFFDGVVGEQPKYIPAFEVYLLVERFLQQAGTAMEEELKKTPDEIALIRFAQDHAIAYLSQYERQRRLPLPLSHIHILKEGGVEEYTEGGSAGGAYSTTLGDIIIDRDSSPLSFALKVFHEHIHWGSWIVLQRTTTDETEAYRAGITIHKRDGSVEFFQDMSEAIVGLFDRRFFYEIASQEERFKKEAATFSIEEFSRPEEVRVLRQVIDELARRNPMLTQGYITEMFIRAELKGYLLNLARLFDQTFGKGRFREFGKGEFSI
ncbi:MAG: hypothetical protein A3C04_04245 [Candidatus Wildermuthbacteria bacterium RIFCSPHIGHO2_02_FULL_45_25]|uniref:Uncharacterized protein n=1 Tax=Candidatus Wildermuthbacteria bacterium RIFCSPHIGHO2_02_FULL_45_25 TaxID=1802450 RepID=A0A1G2R6E9_9BACT|nr:MAG: hypothetical protein A3C04_04245 [Candidatus Wildermuthbacteria bacterium RIFCSPHIGHO2_02_FULL_45_25]